MARFEPELYQELAYEFLLEDLHRALFAGCGLGKTATCLMALNHLFEEWMSNGALVIAPLRVCNLTWKNEVRKWEQFQWMRVANLRTEEGIADFRAGRAQIYTINYEALPKFCQTHMYDMRRKLPFDTLIWDELSKAKRHKSVRVDAMRRYWHLIKRHWGLTGTPTPNSKLDLFGQIRTLDNGKRLGSNFFEFRHKYFFSVDRDERKWAIRKTDEMKLEKRIFDMTLVLKSEDYLDIPDVTVEDYEVALPTKAKAAYKELEKKLFLMIDDETKIEALNAAVLIGKLLQITSGALYDENKNIVELHDAKLKALSTIYKGMTEPLMVACQYDHEECRLLMEHPEAVAFSSARGHKAQDELVDKWNRGEIPMLLVKPASVGHGLNLQGGGSTIVWMSMGWSRELYDQLNARLARKGQKFPTRIIRILCRGTADDAVAEAIHEKGEGQQALMDTLENLRMLGRI